MFVHSLNIWQKIILRKKANTDKLRMQLQLPTFMRTNFPEKVVFTIIYLKPKNFHENQFSRENRFHEYLPKTFDGDQKNWCKWELVTKLYSGLMETAVNISK